MQCFSSHNSGHLPSRIQTLMQSLETNPVKEKGDNLRQLEGKIREEPIPMRENTSLGDKRMVGRENQKKNIIQMLVKMGPSDENYEVISVVGKGGLGKTTLVQYVYNDVQVNHHFEVKAWVSMPETEQFDLASVMTTIFNSAMKNNLTSQPLAVAESKLLEEVKNKRFLIVLDDVWTTDPNNWDKLKRPLQHGAKGSKVIITTRLERVAIIMSENSTRNIIPLEDFSDSECWLLFKRHAGLGSDDDLSEMRSDIIRRCGGLPLAAKALGRLFSECQEDSQRREILNSNIWSEEGQVLPVLRLSYFHLPLHLKPIFAYFALFPKGSEFDEMEIIWLWMAQGMLLPKNQEERMEAIGRRYLLQLVSSSLVERSSSNQELYVMHDLVHDLSVWAAGEICLHSMVTPGGSQQQQQLTRTRHVNLFTNDIDQLPCTRQLRTFVGSPEGFHDKQLKDFILSLRSIRTLWLHSSTVEELPECIGDLKLLRYLKLEFEEITLLPESIERLYNLRVLLLAGCNNLRKGVDFGLLKKLRHVRFPKSLWEVMPLGVNKLTNLQSLGDMYLGDDHGRGSMIRELKSLNHLHGELTVIGLEYVTKVEDAREMHLYEKTGLENLCFEWSSGWEHEDGVLEQLTPNSCIKRYELKGYMGLTLPSWLGESAFKNMVEIRLVNCEKCKKLRLLGQLPSLKKLLVERMNSWGRFHDNKFPSLEELVIKGCESFQGTLPPHLPCLKVLKIEMCSQAKVSLPSSPKFEVLKVYSCEALLSSTDMLVIHCSEKMRLKKIKSGFTGLQVGGPCRQGLVVEDCDSLVSIERIPVTANKVEVSLCEKLKRVECEGASASSSSNNNGVSIKISHCESLVSIERIPVAAEKVYVCVCRQLKRVEWEGASESSASNNNGVSIDISGCDSVVRVVNIPLVVARLAIRWCESMEDVIFGGKWNLVESSEATDGDNNGPPQLQLAQLVDLRIWDCPKLRSLTKGLVMPSLQHLEIWGSPKFHIFPPTSLQELNLRRMDMTQGIQEWGLDRLTHLKRLKIEEIGHSGDPIECIIGTDIKHDGDDDDDSILHLPSTLHELDIGDFRNLKTIKFSAFSNLTTLEIGPCQNFAFFRDCGQLQAAPIQILRIWYMDAKKPIQEWGLDLLTHLQELKLVKIRWGGDAVECIEGKDGSPSTTPPPSYSSLYLPSSLRELSIGDTDETVPDQRRSFSGLKSINCSTFPNLTHLDIHSYPDLKSLGPNNDLPPTLKDVSIPGCSKIRSKGFTCFEIGGNRYRISNERQDHST